MVILSTPAQRPHTLWGQLPPRAQNKPTAASRKIKSIFVLLHTTVSQELWKQLSAVVEAKYFAVLNDGDFD
jgi:hypothetical protein